MERGGRADDQRQRPLPTTEWTLVELHNAEVVLGDGESAPHLALVPEGPASLDREAADGDRTLAQLAARVA